MKCRIRTLGLAIALGALAVPAVAAEPERAGEQIVKSQCANCHETGKYGAPRIDDRAAWIPRMKNGLDATVRSAIKGHGKMPARGGLADLTDNELRSAILYLFNTSGPPPKPAEESPLGPNQRVVDGTEIHLGVKPVKDGVYHVNITLRDRKTGAFVSDATVEASVSNPVMGAATKKLERTTIDKTVSYGSDFEVSGNVPHVVTVQVRRPGRTAIEARFDFKG